MLRTIAELLVSVLEQIGVKNIFGLIGDTSAHRVPGLRELLSADMWTLTSRWASDFFVGSC